MEKILLLVKCTLVLSDAQQQSTYSADACIHIQHYISKKNLIVNHFFSVSTSYIMCSIGHEYNEKKKKEVLTVEGWKFTSHFKNLLERKKIERHKKWAIIWKIACQHEKLFSPMSKLLDWRIFMHKKRIRRSEQWKTIKWKYK